MALKRLIVLIATCAMAAGTGLLAAPAGHANGCITPAAGTAQDPFLIATPSNLNCLRGYGADYWGHGYYFKQTADLDMSGYPWTSGIGDDTIPFQGTYDGNGFTISNLNINSTGNDVGVFGVTWDDTLTHITITGLSVVGNFRVGGLVGKQEGGFIDRVSVSGSVLGHTHVGGLIGQVDDSADTTVQASFVEGSVSNLDFGPGVGGLVGYVKPNERAASLLDSYSAADVRGHSQVGGLVGAYFEEHGSSRLRIVDSYASGPLAAIFDDGGVIGCLLEVTNFQCNNPVTTSATVTDSYWDTQTSGTLTTAGSLGTGKTTAQMTSIDTFSAWPISPDISGQSTWGICSPLNTGYPFLQWYAADAGWTCSSTPTPPPAPIPASEPRDVAAAHGDRSAVVTWQAPASTGSYPVSTYMATASPGGRTCLTQTTSCEVTGLTNGTAYTVTVSALTGAGWSSASAPSLPVIPRAVTVRIQAERMGRMLIVSGTTTGVPEGTIAQPYLRVGSQTEFTATATTAIISSDGTFTWSRRLNSRQPVRVYVEVAGVRSNMVTVTPTA